MYLKIYFDPLHSSKMKYFIPYIARHMENMAESTAEDDVQVQVNIKDSQFLSFLEEISLEKYQEDFIKTGISDISHLEDVSEDDIEDFKFLTKFEFKRLLRKYIKAHKNSLHLQKTETIILNNSTRAGNVDASQSDVIALPKAFRNFVQTRDGMGNVVIKTDTLKRQFKNLWYEHPKNPTHYFSNSFIFVQTLYLPM
jgi:hypothetical protein